MIAPDPPPPLQHMATETETPCSCLDVNEGPQELAIAALAVRLLAPTGCSRNRVNDRSRS